VLGEQFAPHWTLFNERSGDHALARKTVDHNKTLFVEALTAHASVPAASPVRQPPRQNRCFEAAECITSSFISCMQDVATAMKLLARRNPCFKSAVDHNRVHRLGVHSSVHTLPLIETPANGMLTL
jgi:hypothetical protein